MLIDRAGISSSGNLFTVFPCAWGGIVIVMLNSKKKKILPVEVTFTSGLEHIFTDALHCIGGMMNAKGKKEDLEISSW